MMKKYFKIVNTVYGLLFTVYCLHAQNLVPNPSFEINTDCNNRNITNAPPWTGPTTNSTDYFNVCSGAVPSISAGYYQYARTGNAYIAFWASFNGPNYREYLQCPLTSNLQPNRCYYIEFYTNVPNYTRTGSNNIAAHLSDTTYTTSLQHPGIILNLIPHALKFGNPVIIDTLNWVKVSGIYTATGGENNIVIGNFFDDANTYSVCLCPSPYSAAYMFIDDVSVTPTDSINLQPFAGNDTAIVVGDSTFIGQQLYGLHCNWYSNNVLLDTNISGIWVKPNVTTTYIVEQNLCGNITYDTVVVTVSPLGINQLLVNGEKLIAFPNPTKEVLNIECGNKNTEIIIIIADIFGNILKQQHLQKNKTSIDVSDLKEGIYFLNIKTKENSYTQKIIVQH
jgi:hypothetical protein